MTSKKIRMTDCFAAPHCVFIYFTSNLWTRTGISFSLGNARFLLTEDLRLNITR